MRKAGIADKQLVVAIISNSFDKNPSVNSVIKNDSKRKERVRSLADYAFETAVKREGIYLSSDMKGVAICYPFNGKKQTIPDYWNQLKLVVKAISIPRTIEILKRESYIKKQRPQSGNYLYFWFFGVLTDARGKGAAKELKDVLFQESENKQLPIYLETSVLKNKKVYERFGFEAYHSWQMNGEGPVIWFMRRDLR